MSIESFEKNCVSLLDIIICFPHTRKRSMKWKKNDVLDYTVLDFTVFSSIQSEDSVSTVNSLYFSNLMINNETIPLWVINKYTRLFGVQVQCLSLPDNDIGLSWIPLHIYHNKHQEGYVSEPVYFRPPKK